jgi:hypothetical protein
VSTVRSPEKGGRTFDAVCLPVTAACELLWNSSTNCKGVMPSPFAMAVTKQQINNLQIMSFNHQVQSNVLIIITVLCVVINLKFFPKGFLNHLQFSFYGDNILAYKSKYFPIDI